MKHTRLFACLAVFTMLASASAIVENNAQAILNEEGKVSENTSFAHSMKKCLSNSEAAPTIGSKFGVQVSALNSGKRSIRFIAEVSTLNVEATFTRGLFALGDDNKVTDDDTAYKEMKDVAVTAAYTSVVNGASTYTPEDGHYLVVYTMNNIPEDYWSYYFNISLTLTYLDADGETQKVTSSSHYANVYGALYGDNLKSSSDVCAVFASATVTSATPDYVMKRSDDTHPYVIYREAGSEVDPSSVTALSFDSSVTSIASGVFSTQTDSTASPAYLGYTATYANLTSVDFSNSSVAVYDYAFAGCTGLTEISFPENSNGVQQSQKIYDGAFANTGLTYAELPDSTNIEEYSFGGCTSLKEVVIHNECLCNLEFAGCTALEKVTFAEDINVSLNSSGGTSNAGSLVWISGYSSTTEYEKHDSFQGCTALKEVNVYCNTIASRPDLWSYHFTGFTNLETFNATGATSLSAYMFQGCTGLKNVNITTNIVKIQDNTFASCGANVTLNFDGTLSQFESVSKGSNWYTGANVTVKASDGETVYNGL